MSEPEKGRRQEVETPPLGSTEAQAEDPCANIEDPVRRGLCRVCQAPVIGEASFCIDHEPPVP